MCIECFRLAVPSVCVCVCVLDTLYTLQLFQFEWKAPSRLQPQPAACCCCLCHCHWHWGWWRWTSWSFGCFKFDLWLNLLFCLLFYQHILCVCVCIVFNRQVQASSWRHGQIKRSDRHRYSCTAKEGLEKFVEYVLFPLIALNANTAMTSFVGGYCHTLKLKLSHELT